MPSGEGGNHPIYYQHFTGETFFQHHPPIDPSSLTRWRQRIGEFGGLRHWFERAAERGGVDADADDPGRAEGRGAR